MDSLAFLDQGSRNQVEPIYVLHGDEGFLKRQALELLRTLVLGHDESAFGFARFTGDTAEFATVHDELFTLPFLGGRRLVAVENADPFVTNHRAALEGYVAKPAKSSVLVLEVKTWVSTTRLAKQLSANATIVCKAPAAFRLPDWCVKWAASRHGKQLDRPAAVLLVELVGQEMGLLDQEIEKLATYVGSAARIEADDVDRLVGSSRAESTWKIFDAIGAGQTAEALGILDRLFTQGEEPIRILGAFSLQLRRLAQAGRLQQQGTPVALAIQEAGFPPFASKGGEQQLRHLGRRRLECIYDWLLDTDLGMKGSSSLSPRTILERLVIKLARKDATV